ncbi:MAG: patatin-like phospholipase family protein, partial [Kiloniellales bacterium]|nr:patatin-like phospholipase family protein [Kiloniellales bacterium]
RVLSIDGGGIRGILAASGLALLQRRADRQIADLFDFIAGTSTGGLVALGLTVPGEDGQPRYSARQVMKLYEVFGPKVFSRSVWHQIRAVGNLADGKYPAAGLEGMLNELFGGARLKDALVDVLVPSYEIERRIPFFFKSWRAIENERYDFAMAQVVRAGTAAPTYFEPAHIPADGDDYYALVDGAVVAYNPGLCAYVEARQLYPEAKDFLVVSLGTGQLTRRLPYDDAKDWGAARWAEPIFSVMCDSSASAVDYQLEQLLPPGPHGKRRYYRFQVRLDTGSDDMDDASGTNLRVLKLLGEDMLLRNRSRLRTLSQHLAEYAELG